MPKLPPMTKSGYQLSIHAYNMRAYSMLVDSDIRTSG